MKCAKWELDLNFIHSLYCYIKRIVSFELKTKNELNEIIAISDPPKDYCQPKQVNGIESGQTPLH